MKPFLRLSEMLIGMGDMDDNGYRNASASSNKIESFFATNAPCYFFCGTLPKIQSQKQLSFSALA
jgi:hypothetical protein